MPDPANLPLAIGVFALAALAIVFFGTRLTGLADKLADRTGMGEAIAGALLLGATTSLPGIVASVTAAYDGYPQLAVSNALGGIAAQTVFLAVADITYRDANLEHAAASAENIMQGALLMTLLSIPLLAASSPALTVWGVQPATPLMLATYIYGLKLVSKARSEPMWRPHRTRETRTDEPDDQNVRRTSSWGLWLRFAGAAAVVAVAGWLIARSGIALIDQSGLSETIVGTVFTAISTSLPELVAALVAVQRGALTLAIGNIIGGNAFDTLFIAVADIAYRDGSIYHAIAQQQTFQMSLTLLMTGILVMGLIRREKRGVANIGFESFLIPILYIGSIAMLFLSSW